MFGRDAGLGAGVLDLAAEPVHGGPQRRPTAPPVAAVADGLQQPVGGHERADVVGQQPQQPELRRRQVQVALTTPGQGQGGVQGEVADAAAGADHLLGYTC